MSLKLPTTVLSHWNNMVEGLQQSSNDFYLEAAVNLEKHQIKDVKMERVTLAEGGIFSSKREYLQIRQKEFVYHICAAPYGNGFFVSSWLGELESGFVAWLCSIPYLGAIARFFRQFSKPLTYYNIDTAQMFHSVVHASVTAALDSVLQARGMRAMTEAERKPVARDLFDRMK
jgi:hypothetical protein